MIRGVRAIIHICMYKCTSWSLAATRLLKLHQVHVMLDILHKINKDDLFSKELCSGFYSYLAREDKSQLQREKDPEQEWVTVAFKCGECRKRGVVSEELHLLQVETLWVSSGEAELQRTGRWRGRM